MSVRTAFQALALALSLSIVAALTACPSAVSYYTDSDGAKYAICAATDLQGTSAVITNNIASTSACAKLCSDTTTCTKAVYDNTNKVCHIKDATADLNWVSNTQFDVIYINNTLAEGEIIAICPFTTTTYTGSAIYTVCPDTDLQGTSAQIVDNVATTNDCAKLCDTTSGCTQAVYDSAAEVCHIKDTTAMLIWAMNKQFDVIKKNVAQTPAITGQWSDLIRFPIIPVAAYVVPEAPDTSRMLVFSSWGATTFGGAGGYTQFADYNWKTGAISQRQVSNTNHDMFCPGMSQLQDGKLVITGGSDAEKTSIYDPKTNNFTRGPDMNVARGYQSSTTLSNGKIFTIGGSYSGGLGGKNGEIYDPSTNAWTLLDGADVTPMLTDDHEGIWREDNHGWLYGWKNQSVFQAGPSRTQHWYGTSGTGSVVQAATRDTDDAMCGINVMYDIGKIFSAGGASDYDASDGFKTAHITTIGEPNTAATVERVADMAYARAFGNGVVLPDGTILVTGGQKVAHVFTDTDGALAAELFDPATKSWKTLALAAVARNYHSVSLLLPDGTVFSGGGGLCYVGAPGSSDAACNKAVDHADGQIFTPPYLFNSDNSPATRPVISAVSATSVRVGGNLSATMSSSASGVKFSLVRIGSATHSINSDQRRIPVAATTQSGTQYSFTLEKDSGILLPGYYYLFALSSAGVPSIAKTVQVTL
ncbi:kelch domain-containing protein [Truncatella angustata]|uniref:Kelch domain-containing protein n=1 Tax=Truncatella angustata TaxID=152316 RepID=A0A9P9A3W7_9PEZI|nr:kelch domain-containing protein [Truncatella angustata]KAH6660917.1 kelch domain-containing protein [Truncatella angustata]